MYLGFFQNGLMVLESHTRFGEDAMARMLEEVVESSCCNDRQNEFNTTWLES